jgi:hypothetical protein
VDAWWVFGAAFLGLIAAAGYVATRRQSSLMRTWNSLLTPAGRQALGSLELQVLSDASMAEYSLDRAHKARARADLTEATRLLGLAYQVVEESTPERLKRLRGLAVCIRMASAVAPVKALRPRDYNLVPVVAAVGFGAALHHLMLTAVERFLLRVRVLSMGFRIALRVMAGATWSAYHRPSASAPWETFERALGDWKTLDREHVETFRTVVLSLSRLD